MPGPISERALILAPLGRDAHVAAMMLREAGMVARDCSSLCVLVDELQAGAGFAVVAEEALSTADLSGLSDWLNRQEEWSDLPVILLTQRGGGLERNPSADRLLQTLGNVTFLERPFHPTTLVSIANSALRGRRRQYEARARLIQIRESETRYRTLFNSMDEGFCVIEFVDGPSGPLDDYVHVDANPAYERHAGLTSVVGRRVRDMVPDEADGWIRMYRDVLVTGSTIRFERMLEATERHLDLSAFRVEPASRRQVAVLFQDITARKRAELELVTLNETLEKRVSEALAERKLLADIVEGTDSFVQVLDTGRRILAINRAAIRVFGELFGRVPRHGDVLDDILHDRPETAAVLARAWDRAIAGEAFTEVVTLADRRGEERLLEMNFNPLRDQAGRIVGAYQFATDVTDRVLDQQRLAEATARMHEMAKLDTLGQLTGGVAHDFNNLLMPITNALDILNRRYGGVDGRAARMIGNALQSAERAKTLVQRLLGFARRQTLEAGPADVGSLLHGMRDLIASSIGARITLRIEAEPGLPAAFLDANQFELAILNLCVNARDAMPDGGTLTISATPAWDEETPLIQVTVEDTGKGMDDDTLRRAVEPFFTTKHVGAGTGLGLSMVHGLAAQLGGSFTLASLLGTGTTATLLVPVAKAPAPRARNTRPKAPAPAPASLRILLVDDEELVRAGMAEMLRELGHSVAEANGGAKALGMLSSGQDFDILVTDFTMPNMSGVDLARLAGERAPNMPVLVVTGYAGGSLDLGFPQLSKPFRQDELSAVIQSLVGGERSSQARGADQR
ncbi:PAS domain-containing protein [uncultured Alsobacter sp.]|uniref:hybrid sensor histidine kinase/response regulator n=1 Tax=uncultured Alsobacter sp. TaxID=1748258 RepID=UPI0025F8873C|nr:PAS domain-containing protein [uncultured Alsobacter sp.]